MITCTIKHYIDGKATITLNLHKVTIFAVTDDRRVFFVPSYNISYKAYIRKMKVFEMVTGFNFPIPLDGITELTCLHEVNDSYVGVMHKLDIVITVHKGKLLKCISRMNKPQTKPKTKLKNRRWTTKTPQRILDKYDKTSNSIVGQHIGDLSKL